LTKLVNEQGFKLRRFNDDLYDAFGEGAEAVFEGVRGHSDLAKRIDASFRGARKGLGAWSKITDQAYLAQRSRVLGT
jgi:TRAP-type mannitol/chloroaromatic compound transport system substrate-binding protein